MVYFGGKFQIKQNIAQSEKSYDFDNLDEVFNNPEKRIRTESLVRTNRNLGSSKSHEIGAKSGQFLPKIGVFRGRKVARGCFTLIFIKQILMPRFLCKVVPFVF